MATTNRRITLAARPVGFPKPSDFDLIEEPVPRSKDGEILVRGLFLSVDPYMRGRMNDAKSYAAPVALGEVMTGGVTGRVVESKHPDFAIGDYVSGMFGWQEYAVSDGRGVRKLDPSVAPLSTSLGVLGMPGLTAYFGLLEIGRPKPGETVLVSGAAGAVGSIVGQIAKIQGCRAVGIAGTDEKVRHLVEDFGFDDAFNYKTESDYARRIGELCPGGVDIYFDNVGGRITDAAFSRLNTGARIPVCGQISQYNLEKPEMGPRLLWVLIVKQARAEGFLVFQFAEKYAEALHRMTAWVREGKLKYREQIVDGLENAPAAFLGMLKGDNIGKQLVRLAPE